MTNARDLSKTLEEAGRKLVPLLGGNLVDQVWGSERPPPPDKPLRIHKIEFAGQSVADKIQHLQGELKGETQPPAPLSLLIFNQQPVASLPVIKLVLAAVERRVCWEWGRGCRTSLLGCTQSS